MKALIDLLCSKMSLDGFGTKGTDRLFSGMIQGGEV